MSYRTVILAFLLGPGGHMLSQEKEKSAIYMEPFLFMGEARSGPKPEYPELAIRQHLTGKVILEVVLDGDGKIRSLTTLESDAAILSTAVLAAVRQWQFRPSEAFNPQIRASTEEAD